MMDMWKVRSINDEVFAELLDATARFGSFRSAHEGYAVILEELDELWEEVKGVKGERSHRRMREEAIQVAAMAVRFIMDVTDIQRRDVTESESARWAGLVPPATQRTSQSAVPLSPVSVPRQEWPGEPSQPSAPDPSPSHESGHHTPIHDGEGPQALSAAHQPHSSPSDHKAIPGLHYAEPAIWLDHPQE